MTLGCVLRRHACVSEAAEVWLLLCSLHSAHDEEKPFELEISWICDATDRVFQRVPEDVLQAAEAAAKAALEESDMYADCPSSHLLSPPTCHS